MEWFWAILPPLLLIVFYYYRIPTAPSLMRVLFFFLFGILSGLIALGLEWVCEYVAGLVIDWQTIRRSPTGIVLRQLLEVAAIEEGCKFAAVIAPIYYFQHRYRLRPSTVYLFTIAVAAGFTTEENWIYLYYNTASIFERVIGTPVHAMFSAPWGYALGLFFWSRTRFFSNTKLVLMAWLNSVICHALVNLLSGTGAYPPPLCFLSYGLFPFFLWMLWRLEQLLQRSIGKPSRSLITGRKPHQRYWQQTLIVLMLILGGNAILGIFNLVNKVTLLSHSQLLKNTVLVFVLGQFSLNIFLGFLAWMIYRYLRHSARQRSR